MTSEGEDFNLAGPLHLTNVDWKNVDHRRSVAACLVQGVYILERDRQENRQGSQALAPPWWEFFHFQLHSQLVDDADNCIFGAIYEFKSACDCNHLINESPRYVIAFRGTLINGDVFLRDLELDIHIIGNALHQTSRFEIAVQAVWNIVAEFGGLSIWLAGHSLGAAMALLAGKTMAKTGIFLEAFLFSPPFFSAPIEGIKDEKVKQDIRIASSVIAAGFAARQQQNNLSEDPFVVLSAWVPCIFIHPGDHICSEYLAYFEHRKKMGEIGAGGVERLATQNSLGGLLMEESEGPLHLVPSANLVVSWMLARDFQETHGIEQWWRADMLSNSKVYKYE